MGGDRLFTDSNVKDLMNILDVRIRQTLSPQLSNVVRISPAIVTGVGSTGLVSVMLISESGATGTPFDIPNKSGESVSVGDNVWVGWFGELTNAYVMLKSSKGYQSPSGMPSGGNTGQSLVKSSGEDYEIAWNSIYNSNLLDNWDFTNPVNQRNASGTISSAGYFIDRWELISGSVTLSANGIVLDGTVSQKTLLPYVGVNASVKMYSGTATASYGDSTFIITSNGGCISYAKLEIGSISTVENDQPAVYPEQLVKCQYYFYGYSNVYSAAIAYGVAINASTAFVVFSLPSNLRTTPTVEYNSLVVTTHDSYKPGIDVTNVFAIMLCGNSIKASVNVSSGSLSAGEAVLLRLNSDGYVFFDADL